MRGATTALELGREPLQPIESAKDWTVPPGNGANSAVVQKMAILSKIQRLNPSRAKHTCGVFGIANGEGVNEAFIRYHSSGANVASADCGIITAANANQISFTLTDCNTSSGCSPQTGNNFGTVKITDAGTGIVNVDVDLAGNFTWAKTGLEGFTFNLSFSSPVPTLSNVTASNWTPTSGSPQTGFNSDGMGRSSTD